MGQEEHGLDHGRRQLIVLVGSFTAAGLIGCGSDASDAAATEAAPTSSQPACVVRPQQTEGPYFVDERLERSDIRSDPADGSVRPGVALRLAFRVSGIAGGGCAPLVGALVDVWHCDALGVYAGVRDGSFDTRGAKFLRGYQLTNAAGLAQFATVYPGWYSGRAVHIHFKIRTTPAAGRGLEFTSQLYFDESVTDQVHAQPPYDRKGRRDTPNASDGIFRAGGIQLLLPIVAEGAGFATTFDVALQG
jgi:protocatechuate 3,4-dioxygenase beta subunit